MTTSAAKEAIVNISDIFLTLSNKCIELQNHKTTIIIQVIFMYIICHVLARPRANYDIRQSVKFNSVDTGHKFEVKQQTTQCIHD